MLLRDKNIFWMSGEKFMEKWKYDASVINEQIARATERARQADAAEPRAISASYDTLSGRIVIELSNGASVAIPSVLCQGIANASPKEIGKVKITPAGRGLHWEKLDVDLSLPELIKGVYGTRGWMAELGKLGGSSTSPEKAAAARTNGQKGGRPRRMAAAAGRRAVAKKK
ncbi:MAG TPA: DUF2442 domain-containing protein [Pyrinomonadaceae bacterium]|nr:DUF2442 domain-containing protein [Pyrinomonadaceae bacterium]